MKIIRLMLTPMVLLIQLYTELIYRISAYIENNRLEKFIWQGGGIY